MSAKEMFEELGLEYSNNGTQICYCNEYEDKWLWFFLEEKTIELDFDIDMEHLMAINKQVEELGWLDD